MKRLTLALLLASSVFAQTIEHPSDATADIALNATATPDLLAAVRARRPIALSDLQNLATANNPGLIAARARVRSLHALAKQASLMPNLEIGYQGDQIRGGSYHGGEQGAYIQQNIVLGGKLVRARAAGEAQAAAAEAELSIAESRVTGEMALAFYAALRAQAEVATRRDLLATAHDSVLTTRNYANVGQADTPDVLAAEVEEQSAAMDLVRAEREYLAHFATLSALAGEAAMQVRPLDGDLEATPAAPPHDLAERMMRQSPELQAAQQGIALAQSQARVQQSAAVPDLMLKAGEQWNAEELSNRQATGAQSFAQAGITLPLWNRNQFSVAAANVEVERAQATRNQTQLRVNAQAAGFEQQYESARFAAARYKQEVLPRADHALALYREQYSAMHAPYSNVLQWQRRVAELRIAHLHALEEMQDAVVNLTTYGLATRGEAK